MNEIPFAEFLRDFQGDPLGLVGKVPGVFPVDKPTGISSHDVVDIARKRLGMKKVGHGGTLDPLATGLLLILAGRATKLFDAMMRFDKIYEARLRLGVRTDSQDITGEVIEDNSATKLPVEREDFAAALAPFRGEIKQIPPMHSAIKKNGQPLYKLARAGKTVEREPRSVSVYELTVLDFDGENACLRMRVSKGFYVRTLIDDLGQALGVGATMTALRRTAIGPFSLTDATVPEEIKEHP